MAEKAENNNTNTNTNTSTSTGTGTGSKYITLAKQREEEQKKMIVDGIKPPTQNKEQQQEEPEVQAPKEETPKEPKKEPKKKPGRPKVKTEPEKNINVAVPLAVLEKVEIAKAKYHDNLTEYVNAVIAADLQAHFEEYQTIYNLINNK